MLEHMGMRWVGVEAQGDGMGIILGYMGMGSVRGQGT